jgi:hypothetical protein
MVLIERRARLALKACTSLLSKADDLLITTSTAHAEVTAEGVTQDRRIVAVSILPASATCRQAHPVSYCRMQ